MGAFLMPSLGADMDAGTVVEWLVAPGDRVERGDIVAVVDTDKSTIEVEVFESGVVGELLVAPGTEVPVGTPLATIEPTGGAPAPAPAPAPAQASPPAQTPPPTQAPAPAVVATVPTVAKAATHDSGGHHVTRSPLVRHLAGELGVDLDAVTGTGPGASITRDDVEAAAGRPTPLPTRPTPVPAPPVDGDRVRASPLARRRAAAAGLELAAVTGSGPGGAVVARDLAEVGHPTRSEATARPTRSAPRAGDAERRAVAQQRVAALMARSKREIPHYYLRTTIDLTTATAWLEEANRDRPPAERLVPAALLLWATARAAARNPAVNGHWTDGTHHPAEGVQLGIAVSTRGGGLLVPVIVDAHRLTVVETMARVRDLAERARRGVLRSSETGTPTLTVTNLGDTGVEEVFGVIYPPQVAIVGFGRVVPRPWAVGDAVAVRPVVTATLAADHRASNGHDGARFLATIDRYLQGEEEPWNAPTPVA